MIVPDGSSKRQHAAAPHEAATWSVTVATFEFRPPSLARYVKLSVVPP